MAQLASDLAPTLAELARSLSAQISDGTVDAAAELTRAIARADGDRGAAVAVAAQLAGRPLTVAQLAPLTSLLDEPLVHFAVARVAAEGPVALFLEAAARWLPHDEVGDRLSILGLWGAIRLGADEALVKRRIVPLLRSLARRRQSPIEEALLATVAAEQQHADLLELASRGEAHRARDDVKQNIAEYEKDLTADPLGLLAPFAWLGGGATTGPVVRAAPKAGRNDACPCGSGKKYKKCCLEKDEAAAAGGAPAPAVAPSGRSGRRLTKKDVSKLSVPELVELDLTTLETERLGDVCRAFVDVRRLADAERCLAELARRGDAKALAERRDEVLFRAAELGDADCLARQLALVDDRALLFPHDVTLALLRRDEHTLETLLAAAERAARDSASAEELALAVLRASPALGILLARGGFGGQQSSEAMEVLLEEVEYARDTLDLRGADPAWRLFDLVVARDEEEQAEEAAERAAAEKQRAVAEAAELRKSMRLQAAQLQKLENRLRSREEALAAAKQSTRRVRAPGEPDPDEQKRLRQKIAELKARVKESNEERTALKRALAEQSRARGDGDEAELELDAPETDDSDELVGDEATAPRALLVPSFSARATDSLGRIADRVAADALRTVGELAARDEHAWRAVKRAKDMPREVLMARLGIHHRLIFSTDRGTLEILDIVPREGLDLALKRLRSL